MSKIFSNWLSNRKYLLNDAIVRMMKKIGENHMTHEDISDSAECLNMGANVVFFKIMDFSVECMFYVIIYFHLTGAPYIGRFQCLGSLFYLLSCFYYNTVLNLRSYFRLLLRYDTLRFCPLISNLLSNNDFFVCVCVRACTCRSGHIVNRLRLAFQKIYTQKDVRQ